MQLDNFFSRDLFLSDINLPFFLSIFGGWGRQGMKILANLWLKPHCFKYSLLLYMFLVLSKYPHSTLGVLLMYVHIFKMLELWAMQRLQWQLKMDYRSSYLYFWKWKYLKRNEYKFCSVHSFMLTFLTWYKYPWEEAKIRF